MMAEDQAASHSDDVRLSDAEREAAVSRLWTAFATGWITAPEFDERFEQARGAKVRAELTEVLCDLPAEPADGTRPGPAKRAGLRPMPSMQRGRQRISFAVLGVQRCNGRWVVPPVFTAVAIAGAFVLDLRKASFAERETVIRAYGVLGVLKVIVPEGVEVKNGDETVAGAPGAPGSRPLVRILGGGVVGFTSVEVDSMVPSRPPWRSVRVWVIRIR